MAEPTLLKLTRVTRVDLVDKGASYDPVTGEGAHVLIHKRAPDAVRKKIEQRGEKWVVLDADGEKVLGSHDTEADAKAQLAAIEAKKDGPKKDDEEPAEKRAPWWRRGAAILKALGIVKDEYGSAPARTFEEAFLARTMYTVTGCLSDAFGALYETIEGAIRSDEVVDKAGAIRAAVASFNGTVTAKVQEWLDGPVAAVSGGDGDVEKLAGSGLARVEKVHAVLGSMIRDAKEGTMSDPTKKGALVLDLSSLAEPVRKAIEAHIAGLTTERDAAVAKLAEVEKASKPADPYAGLSAEVRKRMEDQDAEIKKLRESNEQTVFVAKAASYKGLPVKPDDDWKVFRAIASLGNEVAKRVHELLDAGDAAMKLAALRPVGSDAPATVGGGDAWAKIEAGGAGLIAKGEKLTKEQAVAKFLETPEGRRLYDEYLGQNPQQVKS